MNVLRHIAGFALCLALGVGGFILFKNSSDRGDASASTAESTAESTAAQTNGDTESGTETSPPATSAIPVSVLIANKQTLSPELTLYGVVESPRQSNLSAAVNADVVAVEVFEGSQVDSGSVMIKLDTTDLELVQAQRRADVAEIQANIDSQKRNHQANLESLGKEQELLELYRRALSRAQKLASSRVGSEAAIDDSLRLVQQQELSLTSRQRAIDEHESANAVLDARLARALAALNQSERDVGRALITAPFNGRVTDVSVSPGNRVRTGDILMSMYDTRYVEARAQLPSRYVQSFQNSLSAGADIQAQGQIEGQQHSLSMDRMGGRIQSGSGSLDALFRFDGENPPQLGRTISLTVKLPPVSNVISLPNTAVRNGDRVYRVIENRLESVNVRRIGEFSNAQGESRIIIKSDQLLDNDRIIVSQLTNAIDGMTVQVRE